jgi:hypothetical protein
LNSFTKLDFSRGCKPVFMIANGPRSFVLGESLRRYVPTVVEEHLNSCFLEVTAV